MPLDFASDQQQLLPILNMDETRPRFVGKPIEDIRLTSNELANRYRTNSKAYDAIIEQVNNLSARKEDKVWKDQIINEVLTNFLPLTETGNWTNASFAIDGETTRLNTDYRVKGIMEKYNQEQTALGIIDQKVTEKSGKQGTAEINKYTQKDVDVIKSMNQSLNNEATQFDETGKILNPYVGVTAPDAIPWDDLGIKINDEIVGDVDLGRLKKEGMSYISSLSLETKTYDKIKGIMDKWIEANPQYKERLLWEEKRDGYSIGKYDAKGKSTIPIVDNNGTIKSKDEIFGTKDIDGKTVSRWQQYGHEYDPKTGQFYIKSYEYDDAGNLVKDKKGNPIPKDDYISNKNFTDMSNYYYTNYRTDPTEENQKALQDYLTSVEMGFGYKDRKFKIADATGEMGMYYKKTAAYLVDNEALIDRKAASDYKNWVKQQSFQTVRTSIYTPSVEPGTMTLSDVMTADPDVQNAFNKKAWENKLTKGGFDLTIPANRKIADNIYEGLRKVNFNGNVLKSDDLTYQGSDISKILNSDEMKNPNNPMLQAINMMLHRTNTPSESAYNTVMYNLQLIGLVTPGTVNYNTEWENEILHITKNESVPISTEIAYDYGNSEGNATPYHLEIARGLMSNSDKTLIRENGKYIPLNQSDIFQKIGSDATMSAADKKKKGVTHNIYAKPLSSNGMYQLVIDGIPYDTKLAGVDVGKFRSMNMAIKTAQDTEGINSSNARILMAEGNQMYALDNYGDMFDGSNNFQGFSKRIGDIQGYNDKGEPVINDTYLLKPNNATGNEANKYINVQFSLNEKANVDRLIQVYGLTENDIQIVNKGNNGYLYKIKVGAYGRAFNNSVGSMITVTKEGNNYNLIGWGNNESDVCQGTINAIHMNPYVQGVDMRGLTDIENYERSIKEGRATKTSSTTVIR